MKSKLSAALVAAGCVLAVSSPANAISVTSNPGTTFTSVPGAVLFDNFDSVQNTAIGTITGGVVKGPASGGPETPVATGNFIYADGALGAALNVTVTMTEPVSYVGFAWGTPDSFNKLDVYDGSTLLGSFSGPSSGNPDYFDIHADPGEAITQLVIAPQHANELANHSCNFSGSKPAFLLGSSQVMCTPTDCAVMTSPRPALRLATRRAGALTRSAPCLICALG